MYNDRYYSNPADKRDIAIQLLLLAIQSSEYKNCVTLVGQIGAIAQMNRLDVQNDVTFPKCIEIEFARYEDCMGFFKDIFSILNIYEHTSFNVMRRTWCDEEELPIEVDIDCILSNDQVVSLVLILSVGILAENYRNLPRKSDLAYYEPEVLFLDAIHQLSKGNMFGIYNPTHTIYIIGKFLYIRPVMFFNILCERYDNPEWWKFIDKAIVSLTCGYYMHYLRDTNEGTDNIYSYAIKCLSSLKNIQHIKLSNILWDPKTVKFVAYGNDKL